MTRAATGASKHIATFSNRQPLWQEPLDTLLDDTPRYLVRRGGVEVGGNAPSTYAPGPTLQAYNWAKRPVGGTIAVDSDLYAKGEAPFDRDLRLLNYRRMRGHCSIRNQK